MFSVGVIQCGDRTMYGWFSVWLLQCGGGTMYGWFSEGVFNGQLRGVQLRVVRC